VPIVAGTVLQGRYRITSTLGMGGMSTVYKALDLRFANVERACAVKEMFDPGGDEALRRQRTANFEREAGLLAVLAHPLIPKVFDYFSEGGNHYLVQEFIPGHNLETLLEQTPEGFLESQLIDWAVAICDVLSYLHGQSPNPIIFRDLKPSNIMAKEDRSLMLIDFGIARTFQHLERGTMIGTEGYAPPEQYRGVADARTDIYALGATLHHLATRVDPRFETPFTFNQRPPRSLNSSLSAAFEAVILRATAYAPSDRFPTAAEFKAELLRCRRGTRLFATPMPTTPPPAPVVVPPPDRAGGLSDRLPASTSDGDGRVRPLPTRADGAKSRRAQVLQTVEALTLAQSEASSAPAQERAPARPQVPVAERLLWSVVTGDEIRGGGTVANDLFLVGSYDTRLYALDLRTGAPVWQFASGRGICSTPLVWRDVVIVGSEDGAVYGLALDNGRVKWRYRTNMPVRSSARLVDEAGGILIGSDDSFVYKLDAASGALLWRYRAYGPVRSSAVLHGGLAIIGSDDGFIYALAPDSGRQVWRYAASKPILASPTVIGGVVVCGSLDGSVYGLGATQGEFRWRFETGGPVIATATGDNGVAYVGSSAGRFYALDVASGERVWEVPHGGRITSSAAMTADYLYYGGLDGSVYCLDRANGAVAWSHVCGKPIPASPALGGNMVVIGCTDNKIYALANGEEV
jgi:outer membrane protein assembly factor BamB/tRNA A-37 threonylcarbamoyl transferase component Bud32